MFLLQEYMTELLFLKDSYLKEIDSQVLAVNGKNILLNKTICYPTGGGQPCDFSILKTENGRSCKVINVKKDAGNIVHEVDQEVLLPGDAVHIVLDWQRRYSLMRMHTAAHVLSATFQRNANALITGNQLDVETSRIDFSLETFDREQIESCVAASNLALAEGHPISVYEISREEAIKKQDLCKLAAGLPETISVLRIVKIGSVDEQPDGGTHVKNTKEVGKIVIKSVENKGQGRKRMYFILENS